MLSIWRALFDFRADEIELAGRRQIGFNLQTFKFVRFEA